MENITRIDWKNSMKIIRHMKDKINTSDSINIDKILKQIEKYDVISFDIFDTLLKRNVSNPTNIFEYIEKYYNQPGFCVKRINAEKKARDKKKNEEITIKDIYNEMDIDFIKEELKIEAELLTLNNDIFPIFESAVQSKIVIITSDMYLPEDFIKKILEREGIIGYKKLYLSSSIGKTKASGELYDYILSEIGKEKRIIHIGDSYSADYIAPKKRGIDVVKIPRNIKKRGFRLKENEIEENIINSFLNNTTPNIENNYYRFGYEKFGMFLWGYSKWIHDSIKKAHINDIYFFSRDGLIMKKAFDILYKDVNTHYLEVSRRSLRVPVLWMNYDFEHVIDMICSSKLIPIVAIFDGIGLDIDNYKELITQYGYNKSTSFDRKTILEDRNLQALYRELVFDIEECSKKEYELLVKYIQQSHLSGDFAVVDIGWSGGMQRYLCEVLNKLEIKARVKGFYIGVADFYKKNVKIIPSLDLNGYLFDFMHDENAVDERSSFVGLLETLFLEQDGSVKNYTNENGYVKSNRLPYEYLENNKPTYEYINVKYIQKGALDFIEKFGCKNINISPDILFEGLRQTGVNPNKNDINMFADFRFFDEGETQYLAKPNTFGYYIFHINALRKDFLSSRWKIGFMKELFKIKLPYQKIYKILLKFK